MKIEYKNIEGGIVQVTTTDERWYYIDMKLFLPSISWISSFYPKGKGFEIWLKNVGEESDAIKKEAGDKGSVIHQAIAELLSGKSVSHDSIFTVDGTEKQISADEYEAVLSFKSWFDENKPKTICYDLTVVNRQEGFAGTLDWLFEMPNGEVYLTDFKSSQDIYMSHKIQVSAYKHTDFIQEKYPNAKLAILQIGYRKNRVKYRFVEIEDCYDLFLATKRIWENEVKDKQPLQRDFPLSITLGGKE